MLRYLFAFVLAIPSLVAAAYDDPVTLVRETTTELFELVENNRAEYEKNPDLLRERLAEILEPRSDMVYSARLVLGRHGRGLEREQVEAFAEALTGLLMRRYASGLLEFRSQEQVEVLPLAGDNSDRMTRVRTRLQLDSGERAPVDYVLRKRDDQWLVFDVIIEGISYIATLRNQIGQEIHRDGFDSMLERLQSGEIDIDLDANGG